MKTKKSQNEIPVVIRLSVLTIFPLIESLGNTISSTEHEKLCYSILDILLNIIKELPELALFNESSDCIDAFKNWIVSMLQEKFKHIIDSPLKLQTVKTLIALSVSRANATQLLETVFQLMSIQKKNGTNFRLELDLAAQIQQIIKFKKDSDFPNLCFPALKGCLYLFFFNSFLLTFPRKMECLSSRLKHTFV